jgi:5-methylcytosine-specific restriction endonuclease McrA
MTRLYDRPEWRRLCKQVLLRDGYVCQIQLPGCRRTATAADHIVSPEAGGAPFDPANCRASCISCNSTKANKARHELDKLASL